MRLDRESGKLALRCDQVQVWRVRLDPPAAAGEAYRSLLSPDEVERMDRYRFEKHRRRYCAGRGTLRALLGRYLDCSPASVKLSYGPQGKPALDRRAAGDPDVRFNLSHSADEAVIAFVLERELGIDIERVDPRVDVEALAKRFFSRAEVERLMELPRDMRRIGFFDCWTRKESFIKACGGGLSLPLADFDVAFGPGVEAELMRVAWDTGAERDWSMAALDVAEGFRGAITVEGGEFTLECKDPTLH